MLKIENVSYQNQFNIIVPDPEMRYGVHTVKSLLQFLRIQKRDNILKFFMSLLIEQT